MKGYMMITHGNIRDSLFDQPDDLPVFNPVALDLLQLLAEPDINYFNVIRKIKEDQSLSAQVLKMSNSPSYAGRSKCETIENSAIRLGTQQIANLAIAASHASVHQSSVPMVNDVMQELWRHSHSCALGCRWIAMKTGYQSLADHAYMAGLLHDIGKLYLLKALERFNRGSDSRVELSREILLNIFSEMHVEFGCRIIDLWNIPPVYRDIVAFHHSGESGSNEFLLAIVRIVNSNSANFNMNHFPTGSSAEDVPTEFSTFLKKDSDLAKLEMVMTEYREEDEEDDM